MFIERQFGLDIESRFVNFIFFQVDTRVQIASILDFLLYKHKR
jgi:hypothetical protein